MAKRLHLLLAYVFLSIFTLTGQISPEEERFFNNDSTSVQETTKPEGPQDKEELLAAQYFRDKEYDKALYIYEKLYNKRQETFYYTPLLSCLIALEDFKKAERIVKRHIKKHPDMPAFLVDLGYVLKKQGDDKKAVEQYKEAISSLRGSPQDVRGLARAFMQRGENDFAIQAFLTGRKLSREPNAFWREIADTYISLNKIPDALKEMFDALESDHLYQEEVRDALWVFLDSGGESREEIFRQELLLRIQKSSGKDAFSELYIWFLIRKGDFEAAFNQCRAIDRRNREDGGRVFDFASMALQHNKYDIAIEAFNYVIEKGRNNQYYIVAKIELARTLFHKVTAVPGFTVAEVKALESVYESTLQEIGINAASIFMVKDYAHILAFYLDNSSKAIDLLNQVIAIPSAKAEARGECKIELADIYLLTGEKWEAILLYKQVEREFKTSTLGHLAKFKGAKFYFYSGDFYLARDQLNVLKAATSKLIANDALQLSMTITDNLDPDSGTVALSYYAAADLLVFQNKFEEALATLDSISKVFLSHPIADNVLFKKAEIMSRRGMYEEAAKYYEEVANTYEWDILADDALFKLAELYESVFKDAEKAREYYKELMLRYPGSIFTVEARKRYRFLRGDQVN